MYDWHDVNNDDDDNDDDDYDNDVDINDYNVVQFKIITAPFHHVGFADFWMADQMNSLVVALLDFQYIICFYAYDWHVKNSKYWISFIS